MRTRKLFMLVLSLCFIFSLAGCSTGDGYAYVPGETALPQDAKPTDPSTEPTQPSEPTTPSQPETEPTTPDVPGADMPPADTYLESITVSDLPCFGDAYPSCCHIPMINTSMAEVGTINKILHNTIIPEYGDFVRATYSYARKDYVLSIFACSQVVDSDAISPYTLNIDLATLTLMSPEETLAALGVDPEEFYQDVYDALLIYWTLFPEEDVADFKDLTLSAENIALAEPLLNEDGTLDALVPIYTPAGSGRYRRRLDLRTGDIQWMPPLRYSFLNKKESCKGGPTWGFTRF